MYYRIKHRFEAKLLLDEMRENGNCVFVGDRILEQAGVLDDSYNDSGKRGGRNRWDYGGYVLFFPNEESYEKAIVDIWDFYNIEPTQYEYADFVGDTEMDEVQWIEKLFLLGSDDSLLLIYPRRTGKG